MRGRYLVTGGAGFVGSHTVAALTGRGDEVVVVDNLRQGHPAAVLGARLVEADIADADVMAAVLADGPWDGVLHFAALSVVGESMREPFRYLIENALHGTRLIEACLAHRVPRFVLSSTAALFGANAPVPIAEDAPVDPGSPYGESKWMLERALLWAERVHGLRSARLRYFNAAGADPDGRLGEDHRPETHLVPLVIDAALGRRETIEVFGNDYPTPDGTCIRDYVHVTDLATAHLLALDRLADGSVTYNLGSGTGHSVLEVIEAVERIGGRKVPLVMAPRRAGDPSRLIASPALIRREAGWAPRHGALDEIVRTAWAWREAHPDGYGD